MYVEALYLPRLRVEESKEVCPTECPLVCAEVETARNELHKSPPTRTARDDNVSAGLQGCERMIDECLSMLGCDMLDHRVEHDNIIPIALRRYMESVVETARDAVLGADMRVHAREELIGVLLHVLVVVVVFGLEAGYPPPWEEVREENAFVADTAAEIEDTQRLIRDGREVRVYPPERLKIHIVVDAIGEHVIGRGAVDTVGRHGILTCQERPKPRLVFMESLLECRERREERMHGDSFGSKIHNFVSSFARSVMKRNGVAISSG